MFSNFEFVTKYLRIWYYPRPLGARQRCVLKEPHLFFPKMCHICQMWHIFHFKIFQRVFIRLKRLYPRFLDFFSNFQFFWKISKNLGLECKIHKHFVKGNFQKNQNENLCFFVGNRQNFNFFLSCQKIQQISVILRGISLKSVKNW